MARDEETIAYPTVGEPAPEFSLPGSSGVTTRLADYRGHRAVVLFFYPKDMTGGCTQEACGFRDNCAALRAAGVEVFGISPDPVGQHDLFVEKHNLNFTLLADEDRAVAQRYGVWRVKSKFGRDYMGIARTTFVVGQDGRVAHVFTDVTADGHADEVLRWVNEHGATR